MGLARLLLIFFIIYLVTKAIRIFVLPFVLRKATDKMKSNMEGRMRDFQAQNDGRQEGEIRVEKNNAGSGGSKRTSKPGAIDDGDYVEFEEVE